MLRADIDMVRRAHITLVALFDTERILLVVTKAHSNP